MRSLIIFLPFIWLVHGFDSEVAKEEARAREHLQLLNQVYLENAQKMSVALWNYVTNITEENAQKRAEVMQEFLKKEKELWLKTIEFNYENFSDDDLKREFKSFSEIGPSALSEDKYASYTKILDEMMKIYSTAKICDYKNASKCDLSLDPDITQIFEKSNDFEEIKHAWVEWRKNAGAPMRSLYKQFVDLSNEVARLNNYSDYGERWRASYDDPDFEEHMESLWLQLKPLYLQMHAYIRFNLRKKYADVIPERGPIPSQFLGSNWAQNWRSVGKEFLPFPDKMDEDITEKLKKQNYTVMKIYKTAEDFFKSINLTEMPELFWKKSVFEKPKDRQLSCHPASLDMLTGNDFRILFCTEVTFEHFTTVHHEMGHIEYFIEYKDQPISYKGAANPGFHEAIGDLIALSVVSHKHLRRIGLVESDSNDQESVLNNLYMNGLAKIVALPLNYLIDLWRWNVFSGNTTSDNYNCAWWELREKYQGISPPVKRSEEDFDPGAAFHIPANLRYIEYFISYVVQYQFHKALCEIAGEYDANDPSKPLHECDIYQHPEAGNALKKMMRLGTSKPWPDAMEMLTGERKMDATGLLEYFKPLYEWLVTQNEKNGAFIGWETKANVFCSA